MSSQEDLGFDQSLPSLCELGTWHLSNFDDFYVFIVVLVFEGISGKNLHTFQKSLQSNFDTSWMQRCRSSGETFVSQAVSHPTFVSRVSPVSPAHSEMLGVKQPGARS